MASRADVPAELGYRWPAEWESHRATWVAWPHRRSTWPGPFEPVVKQFAQFVRTLARFEPVCVLAGSDEVRTDALRHLADATNVSLVDIPTNDAWCRDHGPTFLSGPAHLAPALLDWRYNAWGNKYPPYDNDDAVPRHIAHRLGVRCFQPGMVLEGGAIEGNGRGTLLTTTSCMLNPNRNPGWSRDDIERRLHDWLGVRHILWLEGAELAGDDTDGHVDQLARFVDARTVVVAAESNPTDANYKPLRGLYEQLQTMTDEQGRPLIVERLPVPSAKFYGDDDPQRLPASYCNFCFVNGGVVVPTFDDPHDRQALDILRRLIPDREVVATPAGEFVRGLGACHCLSQQQCEPCQA